jgi:lysophospholipase L1-like esterase
MHLSAFGKILVCLILSFLYLQCKKDSTRPAPAHQVDTTGVKMPTGVCIGNSIIAGHPWRFSGLEIGVLDYPDSPGQISYQLTQLTNFKWINHGWGGQTTTQIRKRFLRDAIGLAENLGGGIDSITLKQRPSYVIIEGGVNDIYYHISLDTIEDNLFWMAATCKQYQIQCIAYNCVGQGWGVFDDAQIKMVSDLNHWFASGVLDSLGVTVIDINSLWNSGIYGGISPYGNDNVHFSSLVFSQDGIHFTKAGYDSVASATFRVVHWL